MDQSLYSSQSFSTPLHKSLFKTRKKRNQFIVQSLQTTSSPKQNQLSTHPPLLRLNSSSSLLHSLNLSSLHSAKQIHAHIIKNGEDWISEHLIFSLIKLCSESGDAQSAAMLFFTGLDTGLLTLSYLDDSVDRGRRDFIDFLRIFQELHRIGALSNPAVLIAALKIFDGLQIHAFLTKSGLDAETLVRRSLMDFYADCKSIESAEKLFREASIKCTALWNKAVTMNVENESWSKAFELFRVMQSLSVKADETTLARFLNACGRLEALMLGKEIHGHVIRSGLSSHLLVSNSLITMYSRNSSLNLARRAFESITNPSIVSWNSIISCCSLNGYLVEAMELFHAMVSSSMKPDLVTWNCLISGHSIHGHSYEVFELFKKMQLNGLKPNSSTITSILRAVSQSNIIKFGKEMHGYVMRHEHESSVYVGTSLIDMYIKCCSLINARKVFDTMKHKNMVTWNSLISGYAYLGFLDEALELLKRMDGEGLKPNLSTWNCLISGCSMNGKSKQALVLIRQLKATGQKPNVISWTALISGCCQNEKYKESLYFFTEMQREGIKPNSATIATVLRACANLALLNNGKELHCFAIRANMNKDIFVATTLIDMYSKSGSLRNAQHVFNKIERKNLASWNAMIMGFATHGEGKGASSLFDEMCRGGLKPDGITFTALLSSCRHSGLINEGWKYFDEMRSKFRVARRVEHYTCMVDLLARGGYLDEALDIIREMPLQKDASLWGALLKACRINRNLDIAELAAKHLFKLEPHNSANYAIMMSLYAHEKRWDDVDNMKMVMNAAELKSKAGWSWIQIGQSLNLFSGEGKQHSEIGEIYFELYQLVSEMRRAGYVPDTSCIVHNVSNEEKERLLMGHTEKLAMTYGLIHTVKNAVIRVIKSTRMCNDCHKLAKYVSDVKGREIYLRDGIRFHHFKGGKCSCNDYW